MNGKGHRVIGIDIGKWTMDAAREGTRAMEQYDNDAAGIARLVCTLDPERDIAVFERTGGYERCLEAQLAAAGVCFAVVHSKRVKAFRVVKGIKAKTDTIDARLLRDFGRHQLDAGQLRLGRLEDLRLAGLVARRRQLSGLVHEERCRHDTAAVDLVQTSIARTIATLEAELATIEAAIEQHIACDPELKLKEQVMCRHVGVAQTTARALLAVLPQLGRATAKEISALGGTAPRVHRSSRSEKRRGLDPGRCAVKVILFYPAQSAMRFDPEIKAFAQRLRARGKAGKVILVAVMHKMLVRLNAAMRDALNSPEVRRAAASAAA